MLLAAVPHAVLPSLLLFGFALLQPARLVALLIGSVVFLVHGLLHRSTELPQDDNAAAPFSFHECNRRWLVGMTGALVSGHGLAGDKAQRVLDDGRIGQDAAV